jgi:hypothetical protein
MHNLLVLLLIDCNLTGADAFWPYITLKTRGILSGWIALYSLFWFFLFKQNCYSELIIRMGSGLHTVSGAHA